MSRVLSIPTQKFLPVAADHTVVLCASFKNKIALCCFKEWFQYSLQIWEFSHQYPRWTVPIGVLASVGGISPACTRLVTFHSRSSGGSVRVWDAHNGGSLAEVSSGDPQPLAIIFDSEDRFYFHYGTH